MPSPYDYDLIRDYLHGLVDRNSATEIAELIAKDETARSIAEGILLLEKNFQNDRDIESYLENFRQAQLKTIQSFATDGRRKRILWLKIAASLIFVSLIGVVFRQMRTSPDAIAIVDSELSRPYAVSNFVRSTGETTPFELGLERYAAQDYPEALRYFKLAAGGTADLATLTFYEALSQLYSGNYEEAIGLFQTEIIKKSRYIQQARWHLALAAIKGGDRRVAKETLSAISEDENHYKHEKAREIYDAVY